jgi:threonine dehydrogenase-like Zn-dependent dehydrogenase
MEPQALPQTQHAIQLVGPGVLKHNRGKHVGAPGPHQLLARVEAVGLCFSDLKLLKQFSEHPRKSEIVEGIERETLGEIPSYVPGPLPTVPGHEVVCRIVAVGEGVKHHRVNERCLVQTDYRALRTCHSNAAFGYNFEGGLQEYVLMDERVVMDAETGERFLIPVGESLSSSAVALVEPWACVEDSYANPERRGIKDGGRLLLCVEPGHNPGPAGELLGRHTAHVTSVGVELPGYAPPVDLGSIPDEGFDDILYFGARRETIELLNDKLAAGGILNIVKGGKRIGEPVSVGIGRVHYAGTRWVGTTGDGAEDSYEVIPPSGEIRPGDRIAVLGAGGPMGQMHVIRCICQGIRGISLVAADVDEVRLRTLQQKAVPLARAAGVDLELIDTSRNPLTGSYSYFALLAPIGALVAEAIARSQEGSIINIFAGIPAATRHPLDLDAYIAGRCFMFGTSGSVIRDMKIVLAKVETDRLDTNCSVDAISGMAGAAEALGAVENRLLAGKIVVYPMLHEIGLIPLADLANHFPTVAERLCDGQWTKAAEAELLRVCAP